MLMCVRGVREKGSPCAHQSQSKHRIRAGTSVLLSLSVWILDLVMVGWRGFGWFGERCREKGCSLFRHFDHVLLGSGLALAPKYTSVSLGLRDWVLSLIHI